MSFGVKRKVFAGIMVTVFLATMVFSATPVQVSAQFTPPDIKIGVVGPWGTTEWWRLWTGATVAAAIINTAGGMCGHRVVLVPINEFSFPFPNPALARTSVKQALDNNPNMKFLIGGVGSECVFAMREEVADFFAANNRPIWFICGASDDGLIDDGPVIDNPYDDVRENYARYKFLFRVTFNSTTLLMTLALALRQLVVPKLLAMYGGPKVKYYVIAENLIWCDGMVDALTNPAVYPVLLGPNVTCVGSTRPAPFTINFGPIIAAVPADVHLVIHIFSTFSGTFYITTYGTLQPDFVTVGINVESQSPLFWPMTGGLCEYETIIDCVGTSTNINPNAKPLSTAGFWNQCLNTFGSPPEGIAFNAYDAIIALNETCSQWISYWTAGTMNQTIPIFEATFRSGLLGTFMYTGPGGKYHDVLCQTDCLLPIWPSGFVRPFVVQWQDGRKEVVWPRGKTVPPDYSSLPYARKWMIPDWMYSLAETDFAGATNPYVTQPYVGLLVPTVGPDGTVDVNDLGTVTAQWFSAPVWTMLEADMTPQDHFIDVYDVVKVAFDFSKSAGAGDPPFP